MFVEEKNLIWYLINLNGMWFMGNNGFLDLGCMVVMQYLNLNSRLFFLCFCKIFMVLIDNVVKFFGLVLILFFRVNFRKEVLVINFNFFLFSDESVLRNWFEFIVDKEIVLNFG